jgi:GT2 family glycosyltransferase
MATWCRKDYLSIIIDALEKQTLPQNKYEIMVCDSYSNDGTDLLMNELCAKYKNLKYINTDKNVLAVKRNICIEAAIAPIVVLMDDDVFPTDKFLEAHLSAHKGVKNTVFCGQVRFPEEWVKSSNYYKYRDSCHLNEKHRDVYKNLPFNKIVVMNMSFKKNEILNKVGLFCEKFIGYGGEDTEFGYRIWKSGMKLVYLKEALVYHREKSPSIISFGEKYFRSGRDGAKVLNLINPDILRNTQLVYFEDSLLNKSILFKFKKTIYRIFVNKTIANIVGFFLIKTDRISFLYNAKLYRYYLAYKFKEGKLAQKDMSLPPDDVKSG